MKYKEFLARCSIATTRSGFSKHYLRTAGMDSILINFSFHPHINQSRKRFCRRIPGPGLQIMLWIHVLLPFTYSHDLNLINCLPNFDLSTQKIKKTSSTLCSDLLNNFYFWVLIYSFVSMFAFCKKLMKKNSHNWWFPAYEFERDPWISYFEYISGQILRLYFNALKYAIWPRNKIILTKNALQAANDNVQHLFFFQPDQWNWLWDSSSGPQSHPNPLLYNQHPVWASGKQHCHQKHLPSWRLEIWGITDHTPALPCLHRRRSNPASHPTPVR